MDILVSRPGKLATPPFNKRNVLECTEYGTTPYNGGGGYELRETFPSGAEQIWQTPPKEYLSNDNPSTYWLWAPYQYSNYYFGSSTLVPKVTVNGESLSADLLPINGHLSWGNGKFRYDVSDIWKTQGGLIGSPNVGYIYQSIKSADSPPRVLMSYYDPNSSKWEGDGWHYFDTTYFQLENSLTIEGSPKGACNSDPNLSTAISVTFDWPDLCYGPMGSPSPLATNGTKRRFGIPIWTGIVRYPEPTGQRATRMAGIPLFDIETKQFSMEFVYGIGANLNYDSGWEMTHKYGTDLSGNKKDMRSLYYRGNSLSTGWFEFEAPTSLSVGSQIRLKNYISPGAGDEPLDAVLELSGFAPFRSAMITAYTDPTESTRKTFESGMLLGVFNIGTMIY